MSIMPADSGDEFLPAPEQSEADLDAVDLMWIERLSRPWSPRPEQPIRPVRCTKLVRNGERKGRQCGRSATLGTTVCEVHGAQLPVVKKAAAARRAEVQLRLIHSSPDAAEVLIDLAENAGSEGVRLKAATEILDRAGVRGGTEIDINVTTSQNPAEVLAERLANLRKRTEQALESERKVIEGVTVDAPVPDDAPATSDIAAAEEQE